MKKIIRHTSQEEAEGLFGFFNAYSENGHLFQQFWEWRNANNEASGGENAVLAKNGNAITGCIGLAGAKLTYAGRSLISCWQQDSLVHPSMRGQGVGSRLIEVGMEGFDVVLAKGTSLPMYALRKKLQFCDAPNSNYLVRVLRRRPPTKSIQLQIAEFLLATYARVIPDVNQCRQVRIEPIIQFDSQFDKVAERRSSESILRVFKNKEYLNWRYTLCPAKNYTIFKAVRGKNIGAIVLNICGPDRDEGWIVDLICETFDKPTAFALVSQAVRYFKKSNVTRIWVFATAPWVRWWLYRFGFLPSRQSPKFTYRFPKKIAFGQELATSSWDFWHGDGDIELYN